MTGKTLAGKLADVRLYSEGQEMIHSLDNIKKDSRLVSLAFPAAKGAGLLRHRAGSRGIRLRRMGPEGDSERYGQKGHEIVVRYEGLEGGCGFGICKMFLPTAAVVGINLAEDAALITDWRFSGDTIPSAPRSEKTLHFGEDEIRSRLTAWYQPKPWYTKDVLAEYAKLLLSASLGAVTDINLENI